MERLVTTAQAAEILGISLQGVHYRIKNNQLKSIKQAGKTYVYLWDDKSKKEGYSASIEEVAEKKEDNSAHFQKVLETKDEQILLLKKSVKWLRRQYQEEIARLEKNQDKMISVFDSEIKLLQSAFNEMRSIYKPQLELRPEKNKFISLLDFTSLMKSYKKSDVEIKNLILKAIKSGDKRFIYSKKTKKVLILNDDFSDFK
ncbi:DNA-binding protein [Arcobacter sp.]|uniref:DNA-binding protein n=1 Tax=Arcobacter sp. TaxID=1872629 RepID=UPI003D13055F